MTPIEANRPFMPDPELKARIARARAVPILEVWGRLDLPPVPKSGLVSNPFREDKHPSLQVGGPKNIAFDHATGESLDPIDLVERTLGCGFKTAIAYCLGESVPDLPARIVPAAKPQIPKAADTEPNRGKVWGTESAALAALETLPRAADSLKVREFFEGEYGLPAIPADWRVFDYPGLGAGVVYPGIGLDGRLVSAKWKGLRRKPDGRREMRFLFGGGGGFLILRSDSPDWLLVGGEEKGAVGWCLGFSTLGGLTGEKSPGPAAARWLVENATGKVLIANDHDATGAKANRNTGADLIAAGFPADRLFVLEWGTDRPEKFDLCDLAKDPAMWDRLLWDFAKPFPVEAQAETPTEADSGPEAGDTVEIEPPRFKTESAADLQKADIPPVRGIIQGVRPVGLSIIAGRPKGGKSWLELARACAIAEGRPFWGVETEAGDILYLALEDSRGRIKSRLQTILGEGYVAPSRLFFAYDWRRLDKGGFDDFRRWLDLYPKASEVILDTLPRIRAARGRGTDTYQADYEETAALQRLAIERDVAIVAIMHTRKMESADPFDAVSGTLGTNASADCIEVLLKARGGGTVLHRTSRDFESGAWNLDFDGGLWSCAGEATEGERAEESGAVTFLEVYLSNGPMESTKVFEAGREAGFSKKSLYKAKDIVGVVCKKEGFGGGAFVWKLPQTITIS
jgi:hypothetical protein